MYGRPLHEAMREKSLSLGTYCLIQSDEVMEIIGHCGYNHVIIDHMFTGIDWSATASMARAAQLFGVAPIVRVQAYPWATGGEDFSVASAVARALGIGANGAMISVGSVAELEKCVAVKKDAKHRRVWLAAGQRQVDPAYPTGLAAPALTGEFIVLPLIELPALVDDIDTMLRIEGLDAIGIGVGDISESVGHPGDVEHPEVWKVVDRVVAAAKPKGISVWVNTGDSYGTVQEMAERIGRLWERGVDAIQVQRPETLLQHVYGQVHAQTAALLSAKSA